MIEIRDMRSSDVEAALRIRLEWLSAQFDVSETTELVGAWFARYPDNEAALALAAEDGDQVVGYLLCALRTHPAAVGRAAEIDEVCVSESYRRRGIGRRLVDTARQRLRHTVDDLTVIRARTDREDKPAQAFLRALGFEHDTLEFTDYLE
ncbi:MAG: GNAT family N-acetyltransferase [Chloroflexi bacterium]|nr:GNAT family N-acetyltransferase [Chloroflexota bacterium]